MMAVTNRDLAVSGLTTCFLLLFVATWVMMVTYPAITGLLGLSLGIAVIYRVLRGY